MDRDLAAFLEPRPVNFSQQVIWRGGQHRLRLRVYITADTPPDAFVLAGRALVIDGARVLVVRNPDGEHVLPGGRREPGEAAIDAVHREVVEETGWSISRPTAFGVLHLHYETPEPVDVGRVIYPDFLWHVFVARPRTFDATARQADDYELDATFRDIAEVLERPLDPFQRFLLEAVARTDGPWVTDPTGDFAIEEPSSADIGFLEDRLYEFNVAATGVGGGLSLAVFLRDESKTIVAGAAGHTWGETCELRQIWVAEPSRGRGLGRRLIAEAEAEAVRRGCRQLVLTTHSFQAPEFYRNLGFEVVAEVPDYPRGHSQLVLRKLL